jgi:drug/metabolite transporter (DMT)-like permease
MKNAEASEIRALLRSGELADIGSARASRRVGPSTAGLITAFAAVYLIWGSTYLGIRYAVETIPPLLMMGLRHSSAGALLFAWARWRGAPAPTWREWVHPALIGALLFLGGHGSLAWAEQRVPSGIAALLVATLPMWIVLLARIAGIERRLSLRALIGLVLGFAGVAVLLGWVLASEPISLLTVAAMLIILVGVGLVNSGQREKHEPERATAERDGGSGGLGRSGDLRSDHRVSERLCPVPVNSVVPPGLGSFSLGVRQR